MRLVNNQRNMFLGVGALILFILIGFFIFPLMGKFRRGSSNQYVSYYELESIEDSLNRKDFQKADLKTANMIFKIAGKEKVKRVGKLDVPNFSCQYILQLDDIWTRKSKGKFGFKVQSEILKKLEASKNSMALEKDFRAVAGWGSINSNFPAGYFPFQMYQNDFVVSSFSQKLQECEIDK